MLRVTFTIDEEQDYDLLMEHLIALGAYDIEDEILPDPEPREQRSERKEKK